MGGWSGAVPNGACRGRRLGSWGCFGRASPSACVMLIHQSLGACCHACCSVDGEDPSWWTRRFDVAASVANLLSPVPKLDPIGAMAAPPKPYRPTVTAVSPPGRATYLFVSSATGHGIQRLSTSLDINACTRLAKGGPVPGGWSRRSSAPLSVPNGVRRPNIGQPNTTPEPKWHLPTGITRLVNGFRGRVCLT